MVLADSEGNSAQPFQYARVLAIFHVNAIYIGPSTFCSDIILFQPYLGFGTDKADRAVWVKFASRFSLDRLFIIYIPTIGVSWIEIF